MAGQDGQSSTCGHGCGEVGELGSKAKAIAAELDEARREAATPIGEAWAKAKENGKKLDDDEQRCSYRTAIRRAVVSVWVLIIPDKQKSYCDRYAAAQVWFKSGTCRDYLLTYRVGKSGDGSTIIKSESMSFVDAGTTTGLDHRKRKDVERLERELLKAIESPRSMRRPAHEAVRVWVLAAVGGFHGGTSEAARQGQSGASRSILCGGCDQAGILAGQFGLAVEDGERMVPNVAQQFFETPCVHRYNSGDR